MAWNIEQIYRNEEVRDEEKEKEGAVYICVCDTKPDIRESANA